MTKAERTRCLILNATASCIAKIGIEKTSITQIAKESKKSRGLVAHYFPQKKHLFIEVVKYILSEFEKVYLKQDLKVDKESSTNQILIDLKINLDFFTNNPTYFRCFFLFYYYASINKSFKRLNTEITLGTIERMSKNIKIYYLGQKRHISNANAYILATAIHRELIGTIQQFFIVDQNQSIENYKRQVIDGCKLRLMQFEC